MEACPHTGTHRPEAESIIIVFFVTSTTKVSDMVHAQAAAEPPTAVFHIDDPCEVVRPVGRRRPVEIGLNIYEWMALRQGALMHRIIDQASKLLNVRQPPVVVPVGS